jgi:prepilin-type processing-associated H-X9-DG protein
MNPKVSAMPVCTEPSKDAFTLTDLLVTLCCVAVVAVFSLTALAHSQQSSDRAVCPNNLRRLMQAWQMYADDNSGRLVASAGSGSWVSGFLDYSPSNADNTNTLKLTSSTYAAIGPYANSPSWFRCPADNSTVLFNSGPRLRVRSYSMNSYSGPNQNPWNGSFQVMTRLTEIPQPDRVFVLLEEHPDSINDGQFVTDPGATGPAGRLVDFPACFHLGGANLGMADSHVVYWQWVDTRTMPPVTGGPLFLNISTPNNRDVDKLAAATSYRK